MPGLPVYLSYPATSPASLLGAVADPALDGYASLPSRAAYLAYTLKGRDGQKGYDSGPGHSTKDLSHSEGSFRRGFVWEH